MAIRVLIVDDQTVVCEGLRVILGSCERLVVVGAAHDGQAALEAAARLRPDVVLMDLKMPRLDGVQATRRLRARFPDVCVLVLSTYDADEWVVNAIRAGAAGYILKDASRDELIGAIERAAAGGTPLTDAIAAKLLTIVRDGAPADRAILTGLTAREQAIWRGLAQGLNNAAIGDELGLAEGTVRNHVSTILSKLGVADRSQAIALAWRHGVVTPTSDADDHRP